MLLRAEVIGIGSDGRTGRAWLGWHGLLLGCGNHSEGRVQSNDLDWVGVVMTDENDESYSMLLVCMICGLLLLCGVAAITQHPQWFRVPDDRLNQARGDLVLPQAATRRGFSAPKVAAPL